MKLTFETEVENLTQAEFNKAVERIRAQLAQLMTPEETTVDAELVDKQTDTTVTPPAATTATTEEALSEKPETVASYPTKQECLTSVFEKDGLKRTEKTVAILEALLDSPAGVAIPALATATSLANQDVAAWFAVTAKKIAAITKVSRGVYKFDRSKIKA